VLNPLGGFTVDKALVYALVNQESRFNPNIVSPAGAYGLMQLTAETAARLAGDKSLRRNPAPLRDPALNLRLGQDYVAKLLTAVKGDVMRAVAAYNCGPGVIQKLTARMGQDADSLMMIESMPSGQTRDYVQRVMAGYWTYRQIFGLDSHTLDAAASGLKAVASADR
jgi:soluble lytic murein transglycosylase-like protein